MPRTPRCPACPRLLPRRGGTLRIGADADPIGLDPTKLAAVSSFDVTALM